MSNSENNTPRTDQDTIHKQEVERLLNDLKSATNPLAKAIRKKLNGNDADIHLARLEAMDLLNSVIAQVSPTEKDRGPQAFTPADLVESYWDSIDSRKGNTPTGFASINKVLEGGFEEDRLVVVLGAPGSGKTSITNHMATHIAESEHPVLYVTSEDTPFTLLAKTIARKGGIPYGAVRNGYKEYKDAINTAHKKFLEVPSTDFLRYVDATQGIKLDEIYEQALDHFGRLEARSKGTPLIVVDYLQRLSRCENLGADARQSTTIFIERLRSMAIDLHCTVVLLSAMNRASGYTPLAATILLEKQCILWRFNGRYSHCAR